MRRDGKDMGERKTLAGRIASVVAKCALLAGAYAATATVVATVGRPIAHDLRLRSFLRQYRYLTEEWTLEFDLAESVAVGNPFDYRDFRLAEMPSFPIASIERRWGGARDVIDKCALIAVCWGSPDREEAARFLCWVLENETNENVRRGASGIVVNFYKEGRWPFIRECLGNSYRTATSPFLRNWLKYRAADVGVKVPGSLPPRYRTQELDDQREPSDQ